MHNCYFGIRGRWKMGAAFDRCLCLCLVALWQIPLLETIELYLTCSPLPSVSRHIDFSQQVSG